MIMIVSKNSVRAYGRKDSHGRKEQNIKHFLAHIKNKLSFDNDDDKNSFMQKGNIMIHNI